MKTISLIAILVLFTGCARFKTTQIDYSYGPDGFIERKVKTVTKAGTLFDSKSKLTELKTTQDDAKQETNVGSVEQESTSESIDKIAELILSITRKAATPAP